MDIDRSELRTRFGFAEFRAGQREAVEAVLEGRDVLAIMPTGSGKSLDYQLPAVVGAGLTVVVSPLIALMQDQHAALVARGTTASRCSPRACHERKITATSIASERAAPGWCMSPPSGSRVAASSTRSPRPTSPGWRSTAHCLSEWGHDFRPDYRRLADVRERLGSPPTIALTATATPRVAKDIVAALGLRNSNTLNAYANITISCSLWREGFSKASASGS